jgi:hypothetical protein
MFPKGLGAMKLRHFTSALVLAGMAAPAFAQSGEQRVVEAEELVVIEPAILENIVFVDGEEERLKREILREVDKRIAKQLDALRRDIRRMLAQRGSQQPNRTAPHAPRAPQPPRPPMAPAAPGERRSRTYFTTPDGRRVEVRRELDVRRAKAEAARKQALQKRAEAMRKHAYLQKKAHGAQAQRLRVQSHSNSKDGYAKVRIEVNGKVIEKMVPLGKSFELEVPGGKVWVKTDGKSSRAKARSGASKRFALKRRQKGGSERKFDFDFDGDHEEMRRKFEQWGKQMGRRGEEFGRRMEQWGKQFEKEMHERARRGHPKGAERREGRGKGAGRVLEFELNEARKQLPELHRQLEKLMRDLDPKEREQLRRAMRELHGALGERESDRPQRSSKARKPQKQQEKAQKSKKMKRAKKSKRQMEEESF